MDKARLIISNQILKMLTQIRQVENLGEDENFSVTIDNGREFVTMLSGVLYLLNAQSEPAGEEVEES